MKSESLLSPDEIVDAGFVYVSFPTFLHNPCDIQNPIMKSYTTGESDLKPLVNKTYRLCSITIESVKDYHERKDILKPLIIEKMKFLGLHYVYSVEKEGSPASGFPNVYCIYVRGCKLPKE